MTTRSLLIQGFQKVGLIFWLVLAPVPLLAANSVLFNNSYWTSMGGIPGANGDVFASVVDGSGNLYIGGTFTIVGDVFATNIAKWNGSSWSAVGSGLNAQVNALAVSGSDLYVGGAFTAAGGSNVNFIAKWDGSNWSALGSGLDARVNALAVSGSDLYAGGDFGTAGGNSATGVAKWNGSSWSALGSGLGNVRALAFTRDYLYAAGNLVTPIPGGGRVNFILKWNGTNWSGLGLGVSRFDMFIPIVYALAVSGSDLYAGGSFTVAGGSNGNFIAVNCIAKWDGSSWSALGSGMGTGTATTPFVRALTVSGGDVYAGGRFNTAGENLANNVAQWNESSWSALGSGLTARLSVLAVNALAVSGSDLYAGGTFTAAVGSNGNSIAKWNGNNWSALGSGISRSPGIPIVYGLAVSGSDLYAGGTFTTAGDSNVNSIAKWDGSRWSAVGSGVLGADPTVRALRAFSKWFAEVKTKTKESGHFQIAMSQIGQVLAHTPPDPNGLWIHHTVADALNGKDAGDMRSGFTVKLFNLRGVHGFSAGKEELELAEGYHMKAEALEENGYQRFATAMRELAKGYERDAEREAQRNPHGH
jgi:hypothetical protein